MKSVLIALSIACVGTFATIHIRADTNIAVNETQAKDEVLAEADRLENEAASRKSKREFKKAADLLTKALALREQKLGPDHPQVARTSFMLAEVYFGTADYRNAEIQYRTVIRIKEKTESSDYPDLRTVLRRLAGVLIAQDKSDEALEIEEKVGDFSPAIGIAQVGFLKPRAIRLEEPTYPKTPLPISELTIKVDLIVGEDGRVISATSSVGIPPFTAAALDAARRSKFKPIYYHGKAVKMVGYIEYRFVRTLLNMP